MREIAAFMVTMVVGVVGFLFAIIWLANTLAFPGQLAKIDQLRLDAAHVDPIQAEATIGQVTLWNQMIRANQTYDRVFLIGILVPDDWQHVQPIPVPAP